MNENEILTPNELDQYIGSIPCQIERMAINAMKKAGITELDFRLNHAIAQNAVGEEESDILKAVLDEEDNTLRLILDTETECDWGYISDQTLENASLIYNALWWELPEK